MTPPLLEAFGEALEGVLSALLGTATSSHAAARPVDGDGWSAAISADAPARGTWTVFVGNTGATAIAADIMGLTVDEPVPAPTVGDTLREALSQALSALCLREVARGARLRLGDLTVATAPAETDIVATFAITCGAIATPLTVSVCGGIELPAVPHVAAAPPMGTSPAGLGSAGAAAGTGSDRLDAILDIELPLIVRFGRTELPLKTLAHLGPGSLIDLGRSADDPVDLLVSNRVVARGEVVVVGGNYGVRVLDVVSPRDRALSMEA